MRILLLSPFFFPEPISTGKYNTVLAQALVRRGAQVEVVASHPLYPSWKPTASNATLKGMTVHRGGLWIRYPKSMAMRRLLFELWYAAFVGWSRLSKREGHVVTIAVFPPTLFSALITLLGKKSRHVGIVHDLQSRLGFTSNNVFVKPLQRLVKFIEGKAFNSCDTLIFLSESMARQAADDHRLPADRVRISYPFVTIGSSNSVNENLVDALPPNTRHVVYSGALGRKQNPWALLAFFRNVSKNLPGLECHIFSEGPIFEQLRSEHEADPVPRVSFHRLVAESDLEELYARSTVQVIPQIQGSSAACLPSKLPNIIASGCAVFAISEPRSELSALVAECGGLATPSWNPVELTASLAVLLDQVGKESTEARRRRVQSLITEKFNLDRLVEFILQEGKPSDPLNSAVLQKQAVG